MGNPVGSSVADPSVQRLVDSCTKELNGHFRTLRHAQVPTSCTGNVEKLSNSATAKQNQVKPSAQLLLI